MGSFAVGPGFFGRQFFNCDHVERIDVGDRVSFSDYDYQARSYCRKIGMRNGYARAVAQSEYKRPCVAVQAFSDQICVHLMFAVPLFRADIVQ
jgi:hypothetical protein